MIWVSQSEAARVLNRNVRTIRRWVREGALPTNKRAQVSAIRARILDQHARGVPAPRPSQPVRHESEILLRLRVQSHYQRNPKELQNPLCTTSTDPRDLNCYFQIPVNEFRRLRQQLEWSDADSVMDHFLSVPKAVPVEVRKEVERDVQHLTSKQIVWLQAYEILLMHGQREFQMAKWTAKHEAFECDSKLINRGVHEIATITGDGRASSRRVKYVPTPEGRRWLKRVEKERRELREEDAAVRKIWKHFAFAQSDYNGDLLPGDRPLSLLRFRSCIPERYPDYFRKHIEVIHVLTAESGPPLHWQTVQELMWRHFKRRFHRRVAKVYARHINRTRRPIRPPALDPSIAWLLGISRRAARYLRRSVEARLHRGFNLKSSVTQVR